MKIFIQAFFTVTILLSLSYALLAAPSGKIVGWGCNNSGETTGVPTEGHTINTGVVVVNGQVLNHVVAISAGSGYGLALNSDSTVCGWGANYLGKAIGVTTEYPYRTSGQVIINGEILTNVATIAAGQTHSLALKKDGTLVSWGALNNGSKVILPSNINKVVAIAAGYDGSLALNSDGTVSGWNMRVPKGLSNITAIAVAKTPYSRGLALRKDGMVIEWSRGVDCENGYVVASNATAVAEGNAHGLALQRDGTVVEWGSYNSRFLGGTTSNTLNNLVILNKQVLSNVVAIAANGDNSMALKRDGTVVVWGNNWFHQTNVPAGLSNVVAISAGENFCLAVTTKEGSNGAP